MSRGAQKKCFGQGGLSDQKRTVAHPQRQLHLGIGRLVLKN